MKRFSKLHKAPTLMNWKSRILDNESLSAYTTNPLTNWQSRIAALIAQQQAMWPMLRNATETLNQAEYKEFSVKGSKVLTQFNPARIVSTAAKVDAASIKARPCFLCAENLPAEEKGIPFGENYVILCNPFPVLKNHLVISEKSHTPQAILTRFEDFLDLTEAVGDEYFTLYNGASCGASAPDHHHFQACSREAVPLFDEVEKWPHDYTQSDSSINAFSLHDYRLNILIARGRTKSVLSEWFRNSYVKLTNPGNPAPVEPMLNLVATFDAHGWTVYLFPRAKHRPSCYYAEGDEKLTISPAGIDLTGILVVPDPSHFSRITTSAIANIYQEITLKLQ